MIRYPVRINGSLNRQREFRTPTETENKCEHFYERFIGWGTWNERRAICDAQDTSSLICDYRHVTKDGTPICLRYWYGPQYEIVDEIEEPYVQKQDDRGNLLYYDEDFNETTKKTDHPVMLPLTELRPIPYLEAHKEHKKDEDGNELYWDTTVTPKKETTESQGYDKDGNLVTFKPVYVYTKPHFFSKQYIDTHGKIFGHKDNKLGWHFDV